MSGVVPSYGELVAANEKQAKALAKAIKQRDALRERLAEVSPACEQISADPRRSPTLCKTCIALRFAEESLDDGLSFCDLCKRDHVAGRCLPRDI